MNRSANGFECSSFDLYFIQVYFTGVSDFVVLFRGLIMCNF